ncbi:MAG: undecaprenyldiphospho-muramoylpentapeptide beta-N-acetylglucosaminyltransferase [Defluviitaleaceae bacterium]|nr:undecaprenyldiphospho-muramoylpentapeptide beta-N-acetylglucosaminyltransferase [Defluviitaleaceae bacterium]
MKRIILTGGGTAGHVNPNIALMPRLKENGYEITYIGGKNGVEKELLNGLGFDLDYREISAGKLRRYIDLKNLTDAFRVIKGFGEAVGIIRSVRPNIVFSKGGFVTVPVVLAARVCGVPVVIHESDITPGLANKIAMPFASAVCASFPETAARIRKATHTGAIIRREITDGDAARARKLCGFTAELPTLLVTGGSAGAVRINTCLRDALPRLTESFNVIHLCGKGKQADVSLTNAGRYHQFEYLSEDMPHVFALADVAVSRAGANTIFELLALKKPNILIPLDKNASRGDQILNAESFAAQGFSVVLREKDMTPASLAAAVSAAYNDRAKYIARMREHRQLTDSIDEVCGIIDAFRKT